MDISVHSFLRMIRLAEPLMMEGGTCLSVSFFGSSRVVRHYNMMGPVKAALEATVRYLAAELGPKGVRVYAVSPGPLKTRASSGIGHFDELIEAAVTRSPGRRLVDIAEVGRVVGFLVSGGASGMTGDTIYVDAGLHNVA
jgi:enoyl-[acyl-carrier protein] reductase I